MIKKVSDLKEDDVISIPDRLVKKCTIRKVYKISEDLSKSPYILLFKENVDYMISLFADELVEVHESSKTENFQQHVEKLQTIVKQLKDASRDMRKSMTVHDATTENVTSLENIESVLSMVVSDVDRAIEAARWNINVSFHVKDRHYIVRRKSKNAGTALTWKELSEIDEARYEGPWKGGKESLEFCQKSCDRRNKEEGMERPKVRGWRPNEHIWEVWTYSAKSGEWKREKSLESEIPVKDKSKKEAIPLCKFCNDPLHDGATVNLHIDCAFMMQKQSFDF